jgi:hypothetical protein
MDRTQGESTRMFNRKEGIMKKINEKLVKITPSGYLYVDGVKKNDVPITPLHVPDVSDIDIRDYCRQWAHRHYRMVIR